MSKKCTLGCTFSSNADGTEVSGCLDCGRNFYGVDDRNKLRVPERSILLQEAEQLVTGDRNRTYGSPTQNFEDTATVWNVQLGHKLTEPLTSGDVAMLMILLKVVRHKASKKRDNWLDIAGYAACGSEVESETP